MAPNLRPRKISPFLDPGLKTSPNALAIVQLSRDNFLPVYLQEPKGEVDGYAEGAVINTRFGSFPHSTLLNVSWGSQVRASTVDTGSRGRKRKRNPVITEDVQDGGGGADTGEERKSVKKAVVANSGFIHILNPTPELWTTSLPHRTQVVYTPDYSYILHRLGARPGSILIEAGAGSGSFSHASARAVYSGYPDTDPEAYGEDVKLENGTKTSSTQKKRGKVYSFEFNEVRYHKMKKEITDHNLDGIIDLTHRDVYNGGFLVDGKSPEADCVFLDLPAPWDALPHFSRKRPETLPPVMTVENGDGGKNTNQDWISPLNPSRSTHICTFSPCIEQVTRTIDALRKHGWVEIDMVELSHKKINVIRERIGMSIAQEKGSSQAPRDVDEAVARLKEVNAKAHDFHSSGRKGTPRATATANGDEEMDLDEEDELDNGSTTQANENDDTQLADSTPPWLQGRLVHRTESEIKTHTSYLTFAVLPQEWSEAQEQAALETWPVGGKTTKVIGSLGREARKQEKRQLLQGKKNRQREKDQNDTQKKEEIPPV
ncbi:hypothetical protein MKZ38_000943 [Zalerion maritima]|uniref:tRNA (adenine(58)-N(1))-methyltransferase catalytic subunit TRM61 n=1 Tax=Zalerion maritima TaxID=339359 RepID=A0AAD5RSK9_9PEZI|nr:hypothetical protein MKZ38_000943 [Zalerion maritima]